MVAGGNLRPQAVINRPLNIWPLKSLYTFLFFCEQILMNVQVQKRMIVIPTLFVRTLKDPMYAAALKDMREMAKPVLVDNVSIHHLIANIIIRT